MKSRIACLVFLMAIDGLAGFAATHPSAKAVPKKEPASTKTEEAPFSNKDVLALAKADLGDSIIVAKIQQVSKEVLDVSADALISLKKSGVSQPVIEAMVKRVDRRNHPVEAGATPSANAGAEKSAQSKAAEKKAQPDPNGPAPKTSEGDSVPSAKDSTVRLFLTEKPTGTYKELERVSAGKYNFAGMTRKRPVIDEELRKKAKELGGNAVINITEDFASVSGVAVILEQK